MEPFELAWIGYLASAVIAASMMMQSIVKFRWINLIGASSFAVYGILIGAIPVFILNSFIVSIDLFFLYRIYQKKELFEILEVQPDSPYMKRFLDFHTREILRFFPDFSCDPKANAISFFVLRNMAVSGLFLAHRTESGTLQVCLDYVIPQYRDYKNGQFVYHRLNDRFKKSGFERVRAKAGTKKHKRYLEKMGFRKTEDGFYEKKM